MKPAAEITAGEWVLCGGRWREVESIDSITVSNGGDIVAKILSRRDDVALTMTDGTTWQAAPDARRHVIPATSLDRTVDDWDVLLVQALGEAS